MPGSSFRRQRDPRAEHRGRGRIPRGALVARLALLWRMSTPLRLCWDRLRPDAGSPPPALVAFLPADVRDSISAMFNWPCYSRRYPLVRPAELMVDPPFDPIFVEGVGR